ncbi:LLM class flavin-dependent oxidoreductase [Streptomyces sp. NPDC005791]|uniref:LLM class flavin-dependent oxidoreductase n=1 Tax=Streptomyces sp. NPDC005791 TaxID=3364732 RepID=UPI00367BBAD8
MVSRSRCAGRCPGPAEQRGAPDPQRRWDLLGCSPPSAIAVRDRVPWWIGGRTPRSLRRALPHGDGWMPFGLPLERLGEMSVRLRGGAERGPPAGPVP